MAHEVLARIDDISDFLQGQSAEAEQLGRLPDATAKKLRESGLMRMLQPKEYGGYEAHPNEFLEAVMATGKHDPATGWIAGVVGVHPWETAMNDDKLQNELWSEDQDAWMASPYAPMGMAIPTEGGYILNGRWSFSSGTDHCNWLVIGALVGDADGKPAMPFQSLHVMVPRPDYTIIEDSWNVVGLQGTGSKDVVVEGAFIPDYRAIDAAKVMDGTAYKESGRDEALYRMPWTAVFPSAISAAVLGICEGALRTAIEYQKDRAGMLGKTSDDPYMMAAIGEASAEIRSSRATLLYNMAEMYDLVEAGKEIPYDMRAYGRRDQVRGAWRAVRAVNELFTRTGGNALRTDMPMHRFWRDANAGLNHAVFTSGPIYHASAALSMGFAPEDVIRKAMI
ncbi:MAG: hydroxylase [Cellvibrionales bacterium]|jgi:alkylation response protein AidB-like acyl-CoA dehydrogenase|nr:hydroxylase [Cellvibrionales bacterium]MDG2472014.1 acyl-CoA dehydrogenase family protein [Pseudomonadales bacterium]HCH20009.1 hydroxylase [Cellvibrionales bacterium]